MKNENYEELITAFIDNELKSPVELQSFKNALKDDPSLEFNIKAENLTKNLLRDKSVKGKISEGKRNIILEAIADEKGKSKRGYSFKKNIYSNRFIGYSTAAIILLAFILLLFNRPAFVNSPENISIQSGEKNMVVVAANNFEDYLSGHKTVQFASNNPEEIKNYFLSNGVNYDTYIPEFKNYSLVGAFVTNQNGVKLANHIYSSKNGKYIYIFQVHEDYFKGDSIILLTNDLLNFLRLGNNYKTSQKNYVTILKHMDSKVLALVSNVDADELPENFIK